MPDFQAGDIICFIGTQVPYLVLDNEIVLDRHGKKGYKLRELISGHEFKHDYEWVDRFYIHKE